MVGEQLAAFATSVTSKQQTSVACVHRAILNLHCIASCTFVMWQVGPTDHAICALSGGVDSTVAATLVHKVLGDRLHCVFVDNGLLRYDVRMASKGGARQSRTTVCAL